jgi:hypothetical protein
MPQNITGPKHWLQKDSRKLVADLFYIMYRIKILLLDICFTRLLITTNEGPVRIQYKCLVPIYVFPEMKLRFKSGLQGSVSQFSHSCICEQFIYSHDRSTTDRSKEYINRSQIHECRNWE